MFTYPGAQYSHDTPDYPGPSPFSNKVTAPCGWVTALLVCLPLFSVVTLVALAHYVVAPNLAVKDYKPATCKIIKIVDVGRRPCEWCEGRQRNGLCHDSTAPCRQVWVLVHPTPNSNETFTNYLHTNIRHLHENKECSHTACGQHGGEAETNSALRTLTVGRHVTCYVINYGLRSILATRDYNESAIVHSILWPIIALIISMVVLILRFVYYCGFSEFVSDLSVCQSYTEVNRGNCCKTCAPEPTAEPNAHQLQTLKKY